MAPSLELAACPLGPLGIGEDFFGKCAGVYQYVDGRVLSISLPWSELPLRPGRGVRLDEQNSNLQRSWGLLVGVGLSHPINPTIQLLTRSKWRHAYS